MKTPTANVFLGFALLATGLLVVLGFLAAGSPSTQRAMRSDELRYEAIESIHSKIRDRFGAYSDNSLPASFKLSDLRLDRWDKDVLLDPETKQPYPFRRIDATNYELDVTFAMSSEDYYRRKGILSKKQLEGPAGKRVIRLQVNSSIY